MYNKNSKNKNSLKTDLLNKSRGFSLIEILVVIVIISAVSAVGMMTYQSIKNSSQLESSQREVATVIKLTQSYAVQGKTQLIDAEQQVPCGYGFRFTSTTEFQIFYNKPLSGEDCQIINEGSDNNKFRFDAAFSVPIENFSLGKNVALTAPAPAYSGIYFTTPDATVHRGNGSILAVGVTRTFVLKFQSLSKNVVINSVGSITEN